MKKICIKCKKYKKNCKFGIDARSKSGLNSACKKCDKKRSMAYKRSKVGLVSRIYNNQRAYDYYVQWLGYRK